MALWVILHFFLSYFLSVVDIDPFKCTGGRGAAILKLSRTPDPTVHVIYGIYVMCHSADMSVAELTILRCSTFA